MRENEQALGSTDCTRQSMRLIHMSSQEPALKTRRCCHGNQVVTGVRTRQLCQNPAEGPPVWRAPRPSNIRDNLKKEFFSLSKFSPADDLAANKN